MRYTPEHFTNTMLPKAERKEAKELIKRMKWCMRNGLMKCYTTPSLEGSKHIVENHFAQLGWEVVWDGLDWRLEQPKG